MCTVPPTHYSLGASFSQRRRVLPPFVERSTVSLTTNSPALRWSRSSASLGRRTKPFFSLLKFKTTVSLCLSRGWSPCDYKFTEIVYGKARKSSREDSPPPVAVPYRNGFGMQNVYGMRAICLHITADAQSALVLLDQQPPKYLRTFCELISAEGPRPQVL